MALVLADRVKETTTTTGQGTITLAGASSGFQSFAVVGNSNTTYYTIAGQGTNEWEVGIGTYTVSGTTLSRDTVLSNSLGTTAKIDFSAGTKDVFVTYPALKSVYYQETGGVVIQESNSANALRVTNTGTGNSILVEDSSNPDSSPLAVDASGNMGLGTTSPSKKLHLSGGAAIGDIATLTDGATITPDFNVSNHFEVTLAGNRQLANPSNLVAGQSGAIRIVQDATGSRTLSYGSYWKFSGGTAPTLTTSANAVDILVYFVESSTRITARLVSDLR